MKKILISFLMIAMITGCNQVIEVDKPKEPTIDEHTEISDELDKTLIRKKIQRIDLYDDVYIEHYRTTYPHNQEQILKDDWYENTYFDYNKIGADEIVFVGFDSAEIEKLNQEIKSQYEECLNTIVYKEGNDETYLREFTLVNYDIYVNDDIVSIVESKNHILYEAGGAPSEYRIFNIDKKSGELLNNSDLMLNYEELSISCIDTLVKRGYKDANGLQEIDEEGIYFDSSELMINEASLIYKKDEQWMVIVELSIFGAGIYFKHIMIE